MVTPRVARSRERRRRMRLFFGQSHASSDEDIDQRTFLSTRRVEPLGVVLLRRDAWCRWPAGEFAAERQAQAAAGGEDRFGGSSAVRSLGETARKAAAPAARQRQRGPRLRGGQFLVAVGVAFLR